jgi:ketosteroid isomerase-like protein
VLFNERRIDQLLALMVDDVRWPDVANGLELKGKPAIRRYWEAQFALTQPQVMPREFVEVGDDVVVAIDQRIFDLDGTLVMGPMVVFHRYSFRAALVSRMVVHQRREDALAS